MRPAINSVRMRISLRSLLQPSFPLLPADAVAAAFLGAVERLVGGFHPLVGRGVLLRRRSDAYRYGRGKIFFRPCTATPLRALIRLLGPIGAAHRHLVGLDRAADRLQRALGLGDVAAGEQHAECLAAVAVGDAAAADRRERPADKSQHLVADIVAMPVVELLEV